VDAAAGVLWVPAPAAVRLAPDAALITGRSPALTP
jgi:hypothetical protein